TMYDEGSNPRPASIIGRRVRTFSDFVCIQLPTYSSAAAFGFSRRIARNIAPDCSSGCITIVSFRDHQICSGTQEAAIAAAYVRGLRSAYPAGLLLGVPPTSLRA